jgi:hypothetical protein
LGMLVHRVRCASEARGQALHRPGVRSCTAIFLPRGPVIWGATQWRFDTLALSSQVIGDTQNPVNEVRRNNVRPDPVINNRASRTLPSDCPENLRQAPIGKTAGPRRFHFIPQQQKFDSTELLNCWDELFLYSSVEKCSQKV